MISNPKKSQMVSWLIKEKDKLTEILDEDSCIVLEASFLEWFNSDRKTSSFPVSIMKKDFIADFKTKTLKNLQNMQTSRITRDCQRYSNLGIVVVVLKSREGKFLVLQDSKGQVCDFPTAFVYHKDFFQAGKDLVINHTKTPFELRGKPVAIAFFI